MKMKKIGPKFYYVVQSLDLSKFPHLGTWGRLPGYADASATGINHQEGWYINNQHIDVTSLSTPDVKMIKKHLVMYCRSIFISLNPFKNASPPISRCFDVPLLFRHQSLRSCLHQLLLFYDIIKPRSSRRVLIKNGHFVVARGGN